MRSVGPDSKQSWVIAWACFIIQIMSFGLAEVSGLFFVATVPRYNTKRELASLPYTLLYCVRSALGPLIGYLGHRFGIRQVTLAGGILSALAVGGCFFVEDIVPLIILWGVVFGFSLGLETSLLNVILNEHFVKNRVKANGLNAAGASIGNMLLSPIISYLIEDAYGLSGTFLIISGFMLNSIPAAIIIILNKPKSSEADTDTYTSDIESVLKVRTSVVPAIDLKMERRFSCSDSQSGSLQIRGSGESTGVGNFYVSAKPPLISILAVQCDTFSNGSNLTFPYYDERKLRSKSGSEVGFVTDFQTENGRFSSEWNEIYSIFSNKNRSKSLVLNPNQLNVIPENDLRKNLPKNCTESSKEVRNDDQRATLVDNDLIAKNERSNSKSSYLDSICRTFLNRQSVELKSNETSVHLNRDENQSTVTSLSEQTKNVWKNRGTNFNNNLEMEYPSKKEKHMTSSHSICISNNDVTCENGKGVPNSNKIGDESKWQIYRLACEPVYLLLLVGSSIYYFTVTAFLTIIVDYATDIGLSITYSSYILIWVGAWDIIGYAILGFIIERGYFTQVKFASLSYLGMCITSAAMVWAPSYIVLLVIITLFEISQAGVIILSAPIVAELIDQDLQATAIASVTLFSAPVSLVISPLIGFFRDGYGSYAGLFYVNSAICFLCCLLFLSIPKVKQRWKA